MLWPVQAMLWPVPSGRVPRSAGVLGARPLSPAHAARGARAVRVREGCPARASSPGRSGDALIRRPSPGRCAGRGVRGRRGTSPRRGCTGAVVCTLPSAPRPPPVSACAPASVALARMSPGPGSRAGRRSRAAVPRPLGPGCAHAPLDQGPRPQPAPRDPEAARTPRLRVRGWLPADASPRPYPLSRQLARLAAGGRVRSRARAGRACRGGAQQGRVCAPRAPAPARCRPRPARRLRARRAGAGAGRARWRGGACPGAPVGPGPL